MHVEVLCPPNTAAHPSAAPPPTTAMRNGGQPVSQINQRKKKVDEVTRFVCNPSLLASLGEGELHNLQCNHCLLSKSPNMTHLTFESGTVQVPSAVQTINQLLVCAPALS